MGYIQQYYLYDQDNYILPDQIIDIEGKVILPDLLYWIYNFIIKSSLNKEFYPLPINVNIKDSRFDYITSYITKGYFTEGYVEKGLTTYSFIDLLFNEKWNGTKFSYMYSEVTDRSQWPKNILRHAMLYPKSARLFVPNTAGTNNIFGITGTDVSLLYDIHKYKTGSSPYLADGYILDGYFEDKPVIFSKADYFEDGYLVEGYTESSDYLKSKYNFDNLTELGKLMYIYLDFMANKRTEKIDWNSPIAKTGNLLTVFYEAYIMQLIFDYYKDEKTNPYSEEIN